MLFFGTRNESFNLPCSSAELEGIAWRDCSRGTKETIWLSGMLKVLSLSARKKLITASSGRRLSSAMPACKKLDGLEQPCATSKLVLL